MTDILKDSDGKSSLSRTAYIISFTLVSIKYALGGMTLLGVDLDAFNAMDATGFLGITAGAYFGRSHTKASK